jgi:hypothetical protein
VIDANGAHALEIDHITLTNSGLLEATGAGGLEIFNATVNNTGNSNGGQIKAVGTGNNVNLGTDTVVGGSLIASGGGLIAITGNSVLDGSTIVAGVKKPALVLGTCEITDSAVLTIDFDGLARRDCEAVGYARGGNRDGVGPRSIDRHVVTGGGHLLGVPIRLRVPAAAGAIDPMDDCHDIASEVFKLKGAPRPRRSVR